MALSVGYHLRTMRKQKTMTLQQLADKTGLSIGYISNIERDLVSPTITVLSDLCTALDTDLTTFLQPLSPKTPVFKKDAREVVYCSESAKTLYESITPNGFKLKGLCVTLQPGAASNDGHGDGNAPHSHASDELGIMLSGTLELTIGEETWLLEEGDCFCIESGTPHWYRNPGDTVSVHYSVNV